MSKDDDELETAYQSLEEGLRSDDEEMKYHIL